VLRSFPFASGSSHVFAVWPGECTFNICSSSTWKGFLEFCFRRTGRVTEGFWRVEPGDVIGFRGPYGNGYPMEAWEGKNLVFVGGGIAMPPIRCAIWYALEHRERYGDISIVYGARTVGDLVFADELHAWSEIEGVRVVTCVDRAAKLLSGRGTSASCRRSCNDRVSLLATRWPW